METNVNYTVVGLFVVVLTCAITLAIIWLSSGLSREATTIYQVFMEESVSGLSVDGQVQYNGVEVGSVSKININHQNPRLVELLLKIKSDTPITVATRAKLDMHTLSGVAYILLEDKGTDMRPLQKRPDQEYPVIQTVPSLFVRLDTALTQLLTTAPEFFAEFSEKFNKVSTSFQQLSDSVHSLLDKTNLRSIKAMLQSTQQSMYLLETQTIPTANQAIKHIDVMTDSIAKISTELRNNPAVLIRGKAPATLGPGEK